ncbi:hypothetical protein ACLIIZ_17740 [Azonexus caeni]|jgi:hypothetical protein|uniref:hypothetical protein n=1 Tax=Azonexus caeni TaxID=266126 RepID=UPI003A891D2E
MNDLTRRLRRTLLLASSLLPLSMTAIFIVGRWPEYWKWIASEDTPMTSLEVAVMYTCALAAWAAAAMHHLRGAADPARRWLVLGAGFLFLSLDDRFAIHERIRDQFLAPHAISLPFLPLAPGDFVLLLYMLGGLLVLPWLLPLWRQHQAARRRFLTGVGVAALAVLVDAWDIHRLDLAGQRLLQTVEECLELAAQVLFLQGILLAWLADAQAGDEHREMS